ncbi:MAG: hypothetical protein HGB02_02475 [Chlorobiaceae bacterium]|nr:hypothetical protein [Chlorobiaceae bacterium]
MPNNQERSPEAVTKLTMQFLAEALGQCPAGLEKSTDRDIVFAVLGFQYGAVLSAAYVAGLDEAAATGIADDVVGRINGMDRQAASKFISVMPMLAGKKYPPIGIGAKAIISFYNAAAEEGKLAAAASLRDILRQIDEA